MTRSCCWGGLRSASSVASSWFAPQTSSWCPGAAPCGSGLHSWCPVMQPRTLSLISLSLFLCVWVIVGYVMVWFLLDKWLVWLCSTWLETDFASIRVQVSPLAVQFIFEKCYPLRLTLLMHSAASIHPFFNVLQIPEIPDCWVKMKTVLSEFLCFIIVRIALCRQPVGFSRFKWGPRLRSLWFVALFANNL